MPTADRDLLFGLIALQNGLIDQAQLVAAFRAWTRERAIGLADHLIARGHVDGEQREAVEAMVALHLKKYGGDPHRSLTGLTAGHSTRERLRALGDAELAETLTHLGSGSGGTEVDFTTTYSIRTATADGGRFRVLRPHARGGLGAVFVALDAELDREVALKQILETHAADPASRERFLQEARVTGGLEHPGIVPVYGLGTYADGRPFYAMRFIKGDSLKEAIERFHKDAALRRDPGRRSLELRKLLRRFLDVCNAIDYAHGRGVLHRDIKPGNIIVGKHGETLVVDWGLAKLTGAADPSRDERTLLPSSASGSSETLPGQALGTPAYMSPEQARGDAERLGPASDVYSLGATLYCLLTGQAPFDGSDLGAVFQAVRQGRFRPPREVDATIDRVLEAVCLRAMAFQPEDRYATPRALAEDIERWMADEPVSAHRDPLPARLGRWGRRHRTAVAAIGLSLATAIVLLIVLNVLVEGARRETARALDRVEKEQARTAAAQAKADANFRRARQAVEDYFTTISQEILLDEPGMQPLRAKLLRSALDYHRAFLAERGGDSEVASELAQSSLRYAEIAYQAGQLDDDQILIYLRDAEARFRALVHRHPDRPEPRIRLAVGLRMLGTVLDDVSRHEDAVRAFEEAIRLLEDLGRDRPGDLSARVELAYALSMLGRRRAKQAGASRVAGELLGRARKILEQVVAERPDELRYRCDLAEIDVESFMTYSGGARRQAEIFRASGEALRLYETLLAHVPNSPRFLGAMGEIHHHRALFHTRRGEHRAAIRENREARRILAGVVVQNPHDTHHRESLMLACRGLGFNLINLGRHEQAIGPLREAVEALDRLVADNPGNASHRKNSAETLSMLGLALLALGRSDEAVATLGRSREMLSKLREKDPQELFIAGDLMLTSTDLGHALVRAGRYREAISAYEAALELCRTTFGADSFHGGEFRAQALLGLAYALRELGRGPEAERAVGEAQALPELETLADASYHFGRYLARGVLFASRASASPGELRALGDRAVEALAVGVKGHTVSTRALRRDPAFDALRGRPDFQVFLMDLDLPADPFAGEE